MVMKRYVRWVVLAVAVGWPFALIAQSSIPPPAGPVTFCGVQTSPTATSYSLSTDGGTFAPLTMAAVKDARCPAASTHSFTVAAAVFTVGTHTLMVRATNTFGSTDGPSYSVVVGIAPGPFTLDAVIP